MTGGDISVDEEMYGAFAAVCTSEERDQNRMLREIAEEQAIGKKLGTMEKHGGGAGNEQDYKDSSDGTVCTGTG